jgi:hypothetical protein
LNKERRAERAVEPSWRKFSDSGCKVRSIVGTAMYSHRCQMQTITGNDQAIALSDAFRCLVKQLDKAGVLQLADLEKAMQVQADFRRSSHEDGVAAAMAFISNGLRR